MAIRNECITNSLLDQPNFLLPSKSFLIQKDTTTEDHHRKKKPPNKNQTNKLYTLQRSTDDQEPQHMSTPKLLHLQLREDGGRGNRKNVRATTIKQVCPRKGCTNMTETMAMSMDMLMWKLGRIRGVLLCMKNYSSLLTAGRISLFQIERPCGLSSVFYNPLPF